MQYTDVSSCRTKLRFIVELDGIHTPGLYWTLLTLYSWGERGRKLAGYGLILDVQEVLFIFIKQLAI